MADDGDRKGFTEGFWVGEGDDVMEVFDDVVDPGPQERSEEIRRAIRLYVDVTRAARDIGYDHLDGRELRHWVRGAMYEQAKRESEE